MLIPDYILLGPTSGGGIEKRRTGQQENLKVQCIHNKELDIPHGMSWIWDNPSELIQNEEKGLGPYYGHINQSLATSCSCKGARFGV